MKHAMRLLKPAYRRVGVVIDPENNLEKANHETEFFTASIADQACDVLTAWGATPVYWSTREVLDAACGRRRPPFSALVNFGTGLNRHFRFGQTPMAIEMLELPYSGPNPFSVMLCRDKHRTKAVVRSVGVQSPRGLLVGSATSEWVNGIQAPLFPVIVKPNDLGNSIGIGCNVAYDIDALRPIVRKLCGEYPEGVLVEQFIPGLEVTVLMLGTEPERMYCLALVDAKGSRLSDSYYRTFEDKTNSQPSVNWRFLGDIVDLKEVARIAARAARCWRILECRDAARFDFRIDRTGGIWFIEANGQPDLDASCGYVRHINRSCFAGDRNGLVREYLATFIDRIDGFIAS